MIEAATIRIARPSDNPDALLPFYRDGLGFEVLYRFEDHDGFDGVMLGRRGAPYHFEFTRAHGHVAGKAPTQDNLVVFYIADATMWRVAVDRMTGAGYPPTPSFNPYWDIAGRTFQDADGYRVVLQHGVWSDDG